MCHVVIVSLTQLMWVLKKCFLFLSSREPVSAEEAEDYRDIISCPMDFTTMQEKFKSSQYHSASDFLEDVKLVFSNAEEYNQPDSDVLTCTVRTEQAFIELLQKSLPGIGYLRRRTRKRLAAHSYEDYDDEEEEESGKKIQNGKQGRASSRQKEDDEEDSGQRKTRQRGGQRNQDDSESEEDEEEEEEDDESVRRKSKRTNRKDYREQDSDNERDSRRTGLRRTARGVTDDKEASSDEDSGVQRHSKRLKRWWRPGCFVFFVFIFLPAPY